MPLLSARGLRVDIAEAERVIVETTGVDPKPWFRTAFGAGSEDRRVLAAVAAAGYRHVPWDVVADDWEPTTSGDAITEAVVRGVLARQPRDGTVVLLHTWPTGTADAIDGLVTRLREAGAELVRLDALDAPGRFGPAGATGATP